MGAVCGFSVVYVFVCVLEREREIVQVPKGKLLQLSVSSGRKASSEAFSKPKAHIFPPNSYTIQSANFSFF